MKKNIYILIFSLFYTVIFAQVNCNQAIPFCGNSGSNTLIFPNSVGIADQGSPGCLDTTPNATWLYFKVDQTGPLVFDLIQNTSFNTAGNPTGTELDVDFAVWGPFNAPTGNCTSLSNLNCPVCPNNTVNPGFYPKDNLIDCSYSTQAVETVTINGATNGQYYLIIVTNYEDVSGFIKLAINPLITTNTDPTDCNLVCGVDLGLDREECDSSVAVSLTATFLSPITSGIPTYVWRKDGIIQPAYNNQKTIAVNQPGTWSVTTTRPGGCFEVTDDVKITYLSNSPVKDPIPLNLCTASVAPYIFTSINQNTLVLNGLNPVDYNIRYYTKQTDAENGTNTGSIPYASLSNYSIGTTTATIWMNINNTNTGCEIVKSFTLNVLASPSGNIVYSGSPYCGSDTTLQTTIGTVTPGGTYTATPAGLSIDPTTGTINPSISLQNAYTINYDIPASGSCAAFHTDTMVAITSSPILTLTSAVATASQTLCNNTSLTNIAYTVGGTGTGASVTGLPLGVTGNYVAGVFTISGTPTEIGTFNYTVTTSGGCLPNAQLIGTITVDPLPTVTLTSALATTSQTLCINTLLTPITYNIGGTGTGASITGLPAGVIGAFAAGVFTISGTPTATGIFNYTVTTTGGCLPSAQLTGIINVNPVSTITLTSPLTSANQTLCVNTLLTNITYSVGVGVTGVSITTGTLPAGVIGSFTGGVFTISGTPTATGTFNYTVTTSGGCLPNAQLTGVITVTSSPTILLTSALGTDNQSVCINNPIKDIITYTIGGSGTGAMITSGLLPTGLTGNFAAGVFTISGSPTISGTFNYTVSTTGGCSTAAFLSGIINVNPDPKPTPGGGFVCVDAVNGNVTSTFTIDSGLSNATHTFEWYNNTTGTPVLITGETDSMYVASASGSYGVKATDSSTGCFSDIVVVTIGTSSGPTNIQLVPSSEFFADIQNITVITSPPGDYEYQIDGQGYQNSNVFLNVSSQPHDIDVRDVNGCGIKSDKIVTVSYPKFFTPNGDGTHDTWNISALSGQINSKILIFDRLGKLLKQISPSGNGWDGTFNGSPLPATDYWFVVNYDESGVSKEFKSHFSIKR